MRRVKGVSYDDENERHNRIIKHISSKPNGSRYVLELVEEDMSHSEEDKIKELIREYLTKNNVQITTKKADGIADSFKKIMDM